MFQGEAHAAGSARGKAKVQASVSSPPGLNLGFAAKA